MSASDGDITQWIRAAKDGDQAALNQIFRRIYPELTRMARVQRAHRDGATLNTTGLVHECFLRFAEREISVRDRGHFLALASRIMRQILVDFARERLSSKRGGEFAAVPLEELEREEEREAMQLIEVHELLDRLAAINERQARVVECRFFAGLSEPETAEALAISERSVSRDWAEAREWLRHAAGES